MKSYVVICAGILLLIGISGYALAAPTIDGDLSEWGLSKLITDNWLVNETWLPDPSESDFANDVIFVIEDNRDPKWGKPDGVHIRGKTYDFIRFFEPKVQHANGNWYPEPVGGESYDLEAVYLYQDNTDVYLAMVTSTDPSKGGGLRPGDLALNLDNNLATGEYGYEYGIVVSSFGPYVQGTILYSPNWEGKGAIIPENPDIIVSPDNADTEVKGYAEMTYSNNWMTVFDNSYDPNPNWVIEMRIPKSSIGLAGKNIQITQIRYADNCLNDHIFIPEFPIFAILLGIVFGLTGLICIIKFKNDS